MSSPTVTSVDFNPTAQNEQNRHVGEDSTVVAALAAWFATAAAIKAARLPGHLVAEMVAAGVNQRAARLAGSMALSVRLPGRTRNGSPSRVDGMSATRRVAAEEPLMRARYVWAAAQRLTDAINDERFTAGLAAEKQYLRQHVAAGQQRRRAAAKVDEAAQESRVLIWRARMDRRTTPECAALNGRFFTADQPPGGALPGAVHPKCRCYPEPARGGAQWLWLP